MRSDQVRRLPAPSAILEQAQVVYGNRVQTNQMKKPLGASKPHIERASTSQGLKQNEVMTKDPKSVMAIADNT
jgi:aspartate carbamoyltransferase catalytic subunit